MREGKEHLVRFTPEAVLPHPIEEAISIPAGAAGTLVTLQFESFPILSNVDGVFGGKGDSSLAFSTSNTFDEEVGLSVADADLTNGQYKINYITGEFSGRKKDSATSETVTYSVPVRLGRLSAKKVKHDTASFATAAATKTLSYKPEQVYFYADQVCHINYEVTATAAQPDLKIPANILYGPFPFGDKSFSHIRDSVDGTLSIIYTTHEEQ